jgi:phosphoribosyl-AMP cyclohydrolase
VKEKRHRDRRWISVGGCCVRATNGVWEGYSSEENAAVASDTDEREMGSRFMPRFDDSGLVTAIVIDSISKDVLMVAFMDNEALAKTRETGLAHFHSRSRGKLWLKGETSGHFLRVAELRVDCDQDALLVIVSPDGAACHTGATSCFYRRVAGDGLERVADA